MFDAITVARKDGGAGAGDFGGADGFGSGEVRHVGKGYFVLLPDMGDDYIGVVLVLLELVVRGEGLGYGVEEADHRGW